MEQVFGKSVMALNNDLGMLKSGISNSEQQLRDYDSLIEDLAKEREKGKGSLRFGRLFVLASAHACSENGQKWP